MVKLLDPPVFFGDQKDLHIHGRLALVFGVLGMILSSFFLVAPLPTFYRIFQQKSTQGYQSFPYSVALFSCALTVYYATIKTNVILITINSVGCFLQFFYLIIYLIYAPRIQKILTLTLLLVFNFGAYVMIVVSTVLLSHGTQRQSIVGWLSAVSSVCVFASPLGIIRRVIKTKSIEYMPFWLSFFLTLNAVCWLAYAISLGDWHIATPNILGIIFGFAQITLFWVYKNKKVEILPAETHTQAALPNVAPTNNDEILPAQTQTQAAVPTPTNNDETRAEIIPLEIN